MADLESDARTPADMNYETPQAIAISPAAGNGVQSREGKVFEMSDSASGTDPEDEIGSDPSGAVKLTMTWQGHSRSDLHSLWNLARTRRAAGELDRAEEAFQQVYLGMCHIVGKTNKDTVAAAFNLADIYATSDRIDLAIKIVEEVVENHVTVKGHRHKGTQQIVLQSVEVLNGWNRQADALALLSLAQEALEISSRINKKEKLHGSRAKKTARETLTSDVDQDLSAIEQHVLNDPKPASIDHGLEVARIRIAMADQRTESLLLAILSQCEGNPDLGLQFLGAHAELLNLYYKLGQVTERQVAIDNALQAVRALWNAYEWDEEKFESFEFTEKTLQIIANAFKCGHRAQAKIMFGVIADTAADVFGSDDERTVWVLISIGLVYQTYAGWLDAEEWFEQAFAGALANPEWGPKDGIVRSLQNALDREHFSYVSDEGRPFKSVFGVTGITICPGRLHLE